MKQFVMDVLKAMAVVYVGFLAAFVVIMAIAATVALTIKIFS